MGDRIIHMNTLSWNTLRARPHDASSHAWVNASTHSPTHPPTHRDTSTNDPHTRTLASTNIDVGVSAIHVANPTSAASDLHIGHISLICTRSYTETPRRV